MAMLVLHPEAVKAAIRMKFGSVADFARRNSIKPQAVRDLLRGQSSVAKPAVAKLLGVEADQLTISRISTDVEGYTNTLTGSHRLNAGAR